MNYNDDDNRIRRKKVSSNDYNYKSKQHQRYYEEKVRLENVSYERKIDNNRIKKYNTTSKDIFNNCIGYIYWSSSSGISICNIVFKRY